MPSAVEDPEEGTSNFTQADPSTLLGMTVNC
jgi:hypothetical protein